MKLLSFLLLGELSLVATYGSEPIDPSRCQTHGAAACICPPMIPPYDGPACMPDFEGGVGEVSLAYRTMMGGRSYRDGCPLPPEDLRVVTFTHWGFDGLIHDGQLVVAAPVAAELLAIMKELYMVRYPLEKARLIDYYDGDDDRSMTDNNSSAFNCRRVTGSAKWSEHSYGQAVDINPLINPFVTSRGVEPAAGAPFANRSQRKMGLIKAGDPIVSIFAKYGWKWGGNWKNSKDYQHFSKSGR